MNKLYDIYNEQTMYIISYRIYLKGTNVEF